MAAERREERIFTAFFHKLFVSFDDFVEFALKKSIFSGKDSFSRLLKARMFVHGIIKARYALLAAFLLAFAPGRALAEAAVSPTASLWADSGFSRVRLVSAVEAVGEGESVSLGLHFRLKKGWKIYWRSPGDAGFPPSLNWSGSKNLDKAVLSWPVPERFSVLGFDTMGYKDEVALPIKATLAKAGEPLSLKVVIDYLACNEICIPLRVNLALDLPPGPPSPSAFTHLINRFAVRVPGDGSAHGLFIEKAELLGAGAALRVSASTTLAFAKPDMYVEGPEGLSFSPPKVKLGGYGKRVTLETSIGGLQNLEEGLAGKSLTITLIDGQRFAEKTLVAQLADAAAAPLAAARTSPGAALGAEPPLLLILAMAIAGGLILNLMPCVLPVLSIKLLGVIKHGGGQRRAVRMSFMASAAGILFSFLVLAGILAALKEAGSVVGWGVQFQHPWFLISMVLIVGLFACNMWGFFTVRLPMWATDLGDKASHIHGLGGSFISGVFATLLATPCSAPFLGTAIGFALSRGVGEIFAIFTALGVGLALPFLLLAAAPGLATRLPKPGPWMLTLQKILGFALAATGVWLLSVLAAQVGLAGAVVIGALTVLAGAALYLTHRLGGKFGRAGAAAVVVLAALAFWTPQGFSPVAPVQASKGADVLDKLWTPFDEAAIGGLVAEGKVVFVDVTADWCITCIVNKTFVLSEGETFKRLSSPSVIAMQADWTLPSDAISEYLARFKRYGIPFNAVYGPGAPDGLVLPELLSQDSVLSAMDKAAGPN
ncbi:MAG TPA: disulfide bond formation protein DsbD [Rhodospirillales bacterium]|nr:disulfide bond formation protein DsbD [Rhodospirillales bacterium]